MVLLGVVARAVTAWLARPSDDLLAWAWVGQVLHAGGNPYAETPRLNWPPLWMLWIGAAETLARGTGLPFGAAVRLLPFAADALSTALLARLSLPLGIAFALHPVALATTGAQAQFDAVPALLALVAVLAVTAGTRGAAALAGVALGVGAGFKTWPVFLAPALAARPVSWPERVRLLVLAVAIPVALCLPVALLAPQGFRDNVLHYASSPGWWGLTALGVLFGGGLPAALAGWVYLHGRLIVLAGMALAWLAAPGLGTRAAAVATLLAFLVFTPGFGPQYLLWLVPLSLLVPGPMARLWNAAAAVTVLAERWLAPALVEPGLGAKRAALDTNHMVNVCRFPLWLLSAAWLVVLLVHGFRRRRPRPSI